MFDCPPGYRLYGKVVMLIGPVKVRGDGLSFRCLFPERHRNGDKNWSGRAWVGRRGNMMARCMSCGARWRDFVRATQTHAGDWWPDQGASRRRFMADQPKPVKVESYTYRDASGEVYAVKDRWEPGFHGNRRDFSWRRPVGAVLRDRLGIPPGVEAWAKGLKAGRYVVAQVSNGFWLTPTTDSNGGVELPEVKAGVYGLAEMLSQPKPWHSPVFIVEGERKADLLAGLGLTAVSGPNGAEVWGMEWGAYFGGRKVVVVPDNNPPGLRYAGNAAASVLFHGAAGVKVLVPGPVWDVGPDKDIADWLLAVPAGERMGRLTGMMARFPAYHQAKVAA